MSRELGAAPSREALVEAAARHVRDVFAVKVAILLPGVGVPRGAALVPVHADPGTFAEADKDLAVAEWVWLHQRPAGSGTDTLPSARPTVLPLKGSRGPVGVLALFPAEEPRLKDPDERQQMIASMKGVSDRIDELAPVSALSAAAAGLRHA